MQYYIEFTFSSDQFLSVDNLMWINCGEQC